jgi:hypothetical protein
MNRRSLLTRGAAAVIVPVLPRLSRADPVAASPAARRVRPSDPSWPDAASWERLNREVGGRLIKVQSPLGTCRDTPDGASCGDLFRELKNP